MFKEYGELSTTLYEHTKPVGHSIDGDIEFYSEKLKTLSGRVLEAGVGTGRILIPLLKKGIIIDGVDISAEMIAQCKRNMAKHNVTANIYKQNLTALCLPHKYDAIIMPTGSICLLPKENIKDILILFHNHLNIGGEIIIDLEMPSSYKEGATSLKSFPLSKETGILFSSANGQIDWIAQKTSTICKYELIERGEVVKTEVSNFTLYWYGIEEFKMLLTIAGFKDFFYEIGYGQQQSGIITFTALK